MSMQVETGLIAQINEAETALLFHEPAGLDQQEHRQHISDVVAEAAAGILVRRVLENWSPRANRADISAVTEGSLVQPGDVQHSVRIFLASVGITAEFYTYDTGVNPRPLNSGYNGRQSITPEVTYAGYQRIAAR